MKQIGILLCLVLCAATYLHSPVFGITADPKSDVTGKKYDKAVITKAVERKTSLIEKQKTKKASISAKISENKKQIAIRIHQHASKLIEKTEQLGEKLDSVWDRVLSRIEKMEANGGIYYRTFACPIFPFNLSGLS